MSDISINTLIKFFEYLLLLQDAVVYASFPTSLARACEALGVCAYMVKYTTYKKCCKLYNIADVSTENLIWYQKLAIVLSKTSWIT